MQTDANVIERSIALPPDVIEQLQGWLKDQVQHALSTNTNDTPSEEIAQKFLEQAYQHANVQLPAHVKNRLFDDILNDFFGFGPIRELLDDPSVTEIMVNKADHVYVERHGKLSKSNITFPDDNAVLQLINRIIQPLGRRISPEIPTVDARLPDGSRVNAVIPPAAIDGPGLTIRKFSREKLLIDDLIRFDSATDDMAEFLEACIVSRLNVLVSGGTGSGKTTLLNILSSFIPEGERIVTIEDAAELQLNQEHVFRLEAQPPSKEGNGEVTIRHLVRNALRMRPDRIIVGEVRGGEALDMLQAMNTGHDGSLTTLHANTPRDAIRRLETLVMLAGYDFPIKIVREQIASSVDLIVQQSRLRDGSRKVTSITEVIGMEGETVILNDIFKYEESGVDDNGKVIGEFKPTGLRPMFENRLIAAGYKLSSDMFFVNLKTAANAK